MSTMVTPAAAASPPLTPLTPLTDEQLRKLDVPGPRYTSYPTADRFVEAFGSQEYRQALRQRAQGAVVGGVLFGASVFSATTSVIRRLTCWSGSQRLQNNWLRHDR